MNGISAYLYGSSARGDSTASSDIDILVICDSNTHFDQRNFDVSKMKFVDSNYRDISVYSFRRIKEMFETGHLYAWHLYLESKFIQGDSDRLKLIGKPSDYSSFESDVKPLYEILCDIPSQIKNNRNNVVYEAGLAYVAARNIAMSVSYFSSDGLSFSAYSPYNLANSKNIFPLDKKDYKLLRQARLAGTRGADAPTFETSLLLKWISDIQTWAFYQIEDIVRGSREKKILR